MTQHICFIGSGNMASSLVGGLIKNQYPAQSITMTDPDIEKCQQLTQQFSVNTTQSNIQAVEQADVIVLSVKPQILRQVCEELKPVIKPGKHLIISIAAGIRSTDIDSWLGQNNSIVRCMPNTPALIQAGASGLYANNASNDDQKKIADTILSAAGITLWVDQENLLDAVTAVSGSGPAYFFLFMEAMQDAGTKLGLSAESAGLLAKQTALGAARMAIEGTDEPSTLRAKVTSKGGTTAAAIESFEKHDFSDMVENALNAAHRRAIELADELGQHS